MIARLPSKIDMLERIVASAEHEPFDQELLNKVGERCNCLKIDDIELHEIMERLEASFVEGLHPETASKAAVKMLPTFIRATSVGEERGRYLALDLGGSHFRVLVIDLNGRSTTIEHSTFELPDEVQKGTGKQLFDHIVHCMAEFMEEHKLLGDDQPKFPLGFTFSFPCRQEGLTSARLLAWTKGFNASGVVGEDVVEMLREACKREKINTDVVAVLNDTTGTMLACSFFHENCYVGLIVGTGTNACYMEKLSNIPKLKGIVDPAKDGLPDEMCINIEWGAFGDDGRLEMYRTGYDRFLDEKTINPGRQLFEKMISGMYLGELVRIVLCDLNDAEEEKLIFREHEKALELLSVPGSFTTRMVSDVERLVLEGGATSLQRIGELLEKEIGIQQPSTTDCAIVAYVCSLLSTRAAHLVAAGISTILKRMDRPSVTVGVDGTLYRVHPTFKDMLVLKIGRLTDEKYDFNLVLSEDGSGRGAAVAAAVATRIENARRVEANKKKHASLERSDRENSERSEKEEKRSARASNGCRLS